MDLDILRHSCSHVMAEAVKELWPGVKLGIGPAIEDGFYYDFDKDEPFTDDDLAKIESVMQRIIGSGEPFVKETLKKQDALELFGKSGEKYKLELLNDIPDEEVSIYKTGNKFFDLCRGPHIGATSDIKAFKLLSVAGAYWRGSENNPMMQRIYGTCFFSQEELNAYLFQLQEAKKRDHRKLGKELGLFDIYYDEAGAGLVFYHPKGAVLRRIIEDYEKDEHFRRGYQMVITPHIMQNTLWQTSGHYGYYKDNMYTLQVEDREFVLKPMNCPGHILIYKSQLRSYKEMPMRLFELGTVYRHEKSGVLHGLLRVRGFTQDDAHIFCLESQLKDEIKGVVDFVFDTMKKFGFTDVAIEISTRPEKSIGSDDDWQRATSALKDSLDEKGLSYTICAGEGAFYGPKIDIKLKDALKRQWQCATIQCDFALPERFDLYYTDNEGKLQRPVMLHRVILGSLERFMGALIEHYAGDFPLWLSPLQAVILPISDEISDYALTLKKLLSDDGFRVDIDLGNDTLNKKIRRAETEKVPYILVVGKKEKESGTVSVRVRKKDKQRVLKKDELVAELKAELS